MQIHENKYDTNSVKLLSTVALLKPLLVPPAQAQRNLNREGREQWEKDDTNVELNVNSQMKKDNRRTEYKRNNDNK